MKLHWSLRLCSNFENFHQEIETLKSILKHNSYAHNLVNHCIKKFLNKLFAQRDLNFTVPKRELICVLPYLGKASLDLKTKLRRTIERNLPFCKLNNFLDLSVDLTLYFISKIHLRKNSALELFIAIGVVAATLLIMEKLSVTFIPVQLKTWGSLILQKNA